MTRKKCQWCRWRDAYPNRLRCFDGVDRYMCEMCWNITKGQNGSVERAETVVQVDDAEA
jgi:hypothetical protein